MREINTAPQVFSSCLGVSKVITFSVTHSRLWCQSITVQNFEWNVEPIVE